MHIPDGVLSPAVCGVTSVLAAGAVGYSLSRMRASLADKAVPLTGMVAALIFAGQMVNFPLPLLPVSGHLMGGVLASALVGPWAGCLAITLVLVVQCVVFADGGITALGANVLHMAVIGAWGGYAVSAATRKFLGNGAQGALFGAVVAAWLSVLAAAALFCVEFALSHPSMPDLGRIFGLMVFYHSIIGIGEAIITGLIVGFVLRQEPELIRAPETSSRLSGLGRLAVAGIVASLAVAAFAAPFASEFPDGLDAVKQRYFSVADAEPLPTAVIPDYEMPAPVASWSESALWGKLSVSLAGLLGTTVVLVSAMLMSRMLSRPHSLSGAAD